MGCAYKYTYILNSEVYCKIHGTVRGVIISTSVYVIFFGMEKKKKFPTRNLKRDYV